MKVWLQVVFGGYRRFWIAWLVGVCLVGIVGSLLVGSRRQCLAALHVQQSHAQDQLDQLYQALNPSRRSDVRRRLETLVEQYKTVCFNSEALDMLAFDLENLATEANLQGLSARHVEGKSDRYVADFKHIAQRFYRLSFYADFPAFIRFVNRLERYQPALFVDTFHIAAEPNPGKPSEVILSVTALCNKQSGLQINIGP
ncbi:hypothetical protein ACFL6U_12305 [Planctomycetota bacterium]